MFSTLNKVDSNLLGAGKIAGTDHCGEAEEFVKDPVVGPAFPLLAILEFFVSKQGYPFW